MSDTPYFDAYEARRRQRGTSIYGVRVSTENAAGTAGTYLNYGSGLISDSGIDSSWCSSGVTGTVTYEVYPKYRLQKTYTFIGDVRVVQDCFIESKAASDAEWVQVDESFNAYSFV
jgi:hypothetical protein